MEYIIFGAGGTGLKALEFLEYYRVYCFADNYSCGNMLANKAIISFQELMAICSDYIIVIASEKYCDELECQLLDHGVKKYFVFHEDHPQVLRNVFPSYWLYRKQEIVSYARSLVFYHIDRYKKIAIYGTNPALPYLISEIAIVSGYGVVTEIITEDMDDKKEYLGVSCVTWENAKKNYDCLIINIRRQDIQHYEHIEELENIAQIDLYDIDDIEASFTNYELERYHDIYKGKRVFIVATGPSLRMEDLEILYENREICISMNKIYRCYDKTNWRADYICMTDQLVTQDVIEDMKKGVQIPGEFFIGDCNIHYGCNEKISNAQYYHVKSGFLDSSCMPKFSNDMRLGAYGGCTVTYDALQMAAYMGFAEIYLLGVDHDYSNDVTESCNHFISDYFLDCEREKYKTPISAHHVKEHEAAYRQAENYSRQHGFRIYNATRGGKLEIFERVDFDSLF